MTGLPSHRPSIVLSLFTLGIFLFGCSRSEHRLKAGLCALRDHNDAHAYAQLKSLAEEGNETAQLVVGVMTATGRGVTTDLAAAGTWLNRVHMDRVDSKYEDDLGSSMADEIAYVLGQYRRGELKFDAAQAITLGGNDSASTLVTEGARFQALPLPPPVDSETGGRGSFAAPAELPRAPDGSIPPPPP